MTNKLGEGIIETSTTVITGDVFNVYMRNMSDSTTDAIMANMAVSIKT